MRFIFSILFLICISDSASAQGVQSLCGPRASLFERLLTDAEKIRIQCINDYYDQKKIEVEKLVADLDKEIQKQKKIIQENAFKAGPVLTTVQCDSRQGGHDPKKVATCKKALELYSALVTQMNHLMGWDTPRTRDFSASPEQVKKSLEITCPDEKTLKTIQPVRYFRKNLYQVYEHCAILGAS